MIEASEADEQRRPDWAALAVAAGLFGAAAIIAWDASGLSGAISRYSGIGAEAFPYGVAVLLAGMAVATAIAAMRGTFPEREPLELGPVAWIVAGLVLQIVLIRPVGFSIATGLLFALTARGFGRGPFWLTIPIGIVFAFILFFIFTQGLQLSLPAGPLERLI